MQTIESINTALALGDFACPPVGSRISVAFQHYHHGRTTEARDAIVVACSSDHTEIKVAPWELREFMQGGRLRNDRHLWWVTESSVWEVRELPEGCPPFEEWPRPEYPQKRALCLE